MPGVTRPIKPTEVASAKKKLVPDYVIEAFNELIAENFVDEESTFGQDRVVARIMSMNRELTRREIFDRGYLDVESLYRNAGWSVVYDKPGYNETYDATFTFKRKRKKRKS